MNIQRWSFCFGLIWAMTAASATPAKPSESSTSKLSKKKLVPDKPNPVEPAPMPPPPAALPLPPPQPRAPDSALIPPASEPTRALEVEAGPSALAPRSVLFVGIRAGLILPFAFLRPAYEVDIEAEYRLPLLEGRVRLGLSAGFAQTTGKGARLIEGRGLEPVFFQNVNYFPIELSGRFEIWRTEHQTVLAGIGYSAYVTQATFNELGFTTSKTSLGHAAVVLVAYRHRLGPGEIGAVARGTFGAVALGQLAKLGSDQLNSISFSASYSFNL